MGWTRKKLLIWGTTYPEFSKAYYETVCTGALDAATGKFVRIYPITLRYQNDPFRLYDWIEADVIQNARDFRLESHKINQASIQVVGHIDTKDEWAERSSWILRPHNVFSSVEALQKAEATDHTSLGVVKPKTVSKIYAWYKPDEERKEWEEARERALVQRDLFVDAETKTRDLAFMPVQYRIKFTCNDPTCVTEHDFSLLDWGTYVLSRKYYATDGASGAERAVISHLEKLLDPATHDSYLFLGNSLAHCRNFMIVGVYYPPKKSVAPKKQMSLLDIG
jgi:hypothetical protein